MVNAVRIRAIGIDRFLGEEREKWTCAECGGVISLHERACSECGKELVIE
jgi:predicted amidophosphoribosyltransferase